MRGEVCRAASIALTGVEGTVVTVEAAVSQQLPGMAIIGLPDTALAEAKLRVRTATTQAGMPLADRFITVNLSPAALPKQGSGFDLAIALSALAASQRLPREQLSSIAHLGELSLDGELRRPAGLLTATVAARELGFRRVMVPERGGAEAALVPDIEVIAVRDLAGAVAWHRGEPEGWRVLPYAGEDTEAGAHSSSASASDDTLSAAGDIADIVGQPDAIEALTIAAAGRHHISLLGPPGAGKTMLATRLPTILPDLTPDEAIAASSIASIGGAPLTGLVQRPPFESPHHTASKMALIGGGSNSEVRPGAITRACHGVLFLDEAPEFPRSVLDALRQPLESGHIEIHRSRIRTSLPARVQLVLAANPCPCGYAGSPDTVAQCSCTPNVRIRYLQRISGPLGDRIDLRLAVRRVPSVMLNDIEAPAPTSGELRERVTQARAAAAVRLEDTPWTTNGEVKGPWLRTTQLRLPRKDTVVLDQALGRGSITLRGYDRVLRVAWTIADLAGLDRPSRNEISRALVLRGGDLL
ncbi:YifB family Mg chelatase-like AAA ATPase [Leucobacter viscericola]|uniref:YifB family Mg chelatase-like AAA ATPase n=1 Tax=Leucobacter viscericola TaxID=2714935 RepID=A0A6G7XCV5_9MICO|nr:YifB family Mg chelatase-like AAA ATPase [Leucobacter viscericola]QIK62237.1 YifB family Mg chelatase-like AAA ATPase [Leucobacter viscericola]